MKMPSSTTNSPGPRDVLRINESELVHTRNSDGTLLILMADSDNVEPRTFLVEGIALLVFEAIDGKQPLEQIISQLAQEIGLDEEAKAELPVMVYSFAADLLKEGVALMEKRK